MSAQESGMTERAAEVLSLAAELRLTPRQQKFCEYLAADPERNQTNAAMAAGYVGPAAAVQGSKLMRIPKIQRYLAAIGKAAGYGRETERRIASAREVLEVLTDHMRADMGSFLARDQDGKVRLEFDIESAAKDGRSKLIKELMVRRGSSKEGEAWTETKVKLVDQQGAADKLARHYKLYEDPKPLGAQQNILLQVIDIHSPQYNPQLAKDLFKAFMSSQNGTDTSRRLPPRNEDDQ